MKRSHTSSLSDWMHNNDNYEPADFHRIAAAGAGENATTARPAKRQHHTPSKRAVRFAPTKAVREFLCAAEERAGMWYTSKEFAKSLAECKEHQTEREERGLEHLKHMAYRKQQRELLLDAVLQVQHQQLLQQPTKLLSQVFDLRLRQASQMISHRDQLSAFQRGQSDALAAIEIFVESVTRARR